MKKVLSGFLLMAAAGCVAGGCAGGGDDDVVVYAGPVFITGDPAQPTAAAISVDRTGRIIGVHAEVPSTDQVDLRVLPGVLALPGLHDAHLHLAGIGRLFEEIDLGGSLTAAEARGRVADFAAAHPEIAVLQGRGWDQNLFPGRSYPTWKDLDEIGGRPVYLRRIDGHSAWVNRPMLALAGIDAGTPDPDGGRILHDDDGEPTGILIDNAVDLVLDVLPDPSAADRERWLIAGAEACAESGLVAAHDMGLTAVDVATLSRLDAAGRLPLRVFGYLEGSEPGILGLLDHVSPGDRFEIAGVKFYSDGALGSRGAALIEEYSDEKGTSGLLILEPEELAALVRDVHERGGRTATHAIGDLGNRVALAAVVAAGESSATRRHRIEHAQIIHPDDFDVFVASGAVASMQPTHCTSDMGWAGSRLGEDRLVGAYAWRTMLDRGIPLAFGSDAPIESQDPLAGIHAAVTRQDASGSPQGGWRPEQKLTTDEAIAAFTAGAAYAVGRDEDLGALTVGRFFDATLLDGDPRGKASQWLDVKPLGTVVGGVLRRLEAD